MRKAEEGKRKGKKSEAGWLERRRHLHFIGIGGSGMSGIAEICLNLGFSVGGSDLQESPATRRLRELGAEVAIGHQPENLAGAELVVYSSAVAPENPERAAARERALPDITRAEMLGELIRMMGESVIVAGSHGKTTTTSLIDAVLSAAGLDPTVIVGGMLNSLGANARLGRGGIIVAESDESDGSFLRFSPSVAVVTNIDHEHLNYYGSVEKLEQAFGRFLRQVPEDGLIVTWREDPRLARMVGGLGKRKARIRSFGFEPEADWSARELKAAGMGMEFTACRDGKPRGRIKVGIPGRHNVLNSLAVLAVAEEFEVDFELTGKALGEFSGVQRRFQVHGEPGGVLVVDDYGHHPTEIRATLEAARKGFGRRLVVLFQPHRYTRTRDLYHEFTTAFAEADVLVLTDIYPASEKPIPGVTGEWLAEGIRKAGPAEVIYLERMEEVVPRLREILKPGDLLLILGAGSIYRVAGQMVAELGEE